MKNLIITALILVVLSLIGCSKDEDIQPQIPPVTKSDVSVVYSNSGRFLDKYEIILISESDSIISIENSNTFYSVPVGKYKIYAHSTPSKMTWENRNIWFDESNPTTTWVTDTLECEFKIKSCDITLTKILTSKEVTVTEKGSYGSQVMGTMIPLIDCDGTEYYLQMKYISNLYSQTSNVTGLKYWYSTFTSFVPSCE